MLHLRKSRGFPGEVDERWSSNCGHIDDLARGESTPGDVILGLRCDEVCSAWLSLKDGHRHDVGRIPRIGCAESDELVCWKARLLAGHGKRFSCKPTSVPDLESSSSAINGKRAVLVAILLQAVGVENSRSAIGCSTHGE